MEEKLENQYRYDYVFQNQVLKGGEKLEINNC